MKFLAYGALAYVVLTLSGCMTAEQAQKRHKETIDHYEKKNNKRFGHLIGRHISFVQKTLGNVGIENPSGYLFPATTSGAFVVPGYGSVGQNTGILCVLNISTNSKGIIKGYSFSGNKITYPYEFCPPLYRKLWAK